MPEQRRNRVVPSRGEWVEIPRWVSHKVPKLPARQDGWTNFAKEAWRAWWSDPASQMWVEADVRQVHALLEIVDEWFRTRKVALLAEERQRSDALGLTQKGKRDLRWRVVDEPAEEKSAARPASDRRARLKVV